MQNSHLHDQKHVLLKINNVIFILIIYNILSIDLILPKTGQSIDSWVWVTSAPAAAANGVAVCVTNDAVYVFRGGTTTFWKYSPVTDSWVWLSSAPAATGTGSDLVWAGGDFIYATRGAFTNEFWEYHISGDSWTVKASLPVNVSSGCSLVWTGGNYIYATQGDGTYFYMYDISQNLWYSTAPIPTAVGSGSEMAWTGGNFIYTERGGPSTANMFYWYSILGTSWTEAGTVRRAPGEPGIGASLVWNRNYFLFRHRGANSKDFHKYCLLHSSWNCSQDNLPYSDPVDTPISVGTVRGQRLGVVGDYIYCFGGTGQSSMLRYRWRDIDAPGKITGFVAEPGVNCGEINLSWICPGNDKIDDNTNAGDLPKGSTFYIQYTSAKENVVFSTFSPQNVYAIWITTGPVSQGQKVSYTVTGLLEDVTYYFRIWAKDNAGNWSCMSEATTCFIDTPPPKPQNISVLASGNSILISWDTVNVFDLDYYELWCDSTTETLWDDGGCFIATVTKNTSFLHVNLENYVTYYYRIRAVDLPPTVLYSDFSDSISTYPIPTPPFAPSLNYDLTETTTWQIKWILTDNSINEESLHISSDTNISARLWTSEALAGYGKTTSWVETEFTPNQQVTRYAEAYSTFGSSWSFAVTVYTKANPPTELSIYFVGYSSVGIQWSNNNNPSYTQYEVSYSTDNFVTHFSTPVKFIDSFVELSTTIINLLNSTTYWFRVRAYNNDGIETSFSNIVSTKTLPLLQPDICITEILANDSHSSEGPGEFIEVYNCGSIAVDLAEMYLCSEGDTNDNIIDYTGTYDLGQPGTILQPGWYALIVDPDYDGWYNICIQQHADLNKMIMLTIGQDTKLGSGGLINSFGSVWIVSGTVVLTSFTWVSDAGNGKSWEKIDYSKAAIDRSDSGNWAVSFHQSDNNSYCTPGFLNSVSTSNGSVPANTANPGDVVINEFLYDAASIDNGNEWIEFYNNLSTRTFNLTGWKIQKTTGPTLNVAVWRDLFTITSGSISAKGYFLCTQSTASLYFAADFIYSDSATMNNSAPFAIRLVDSAGNEIDRVAYGGSGSDDLAEGGKAAIDVSAGQSLSRSPDGKDTNNNYRDFKVLSVPTPTNSLGSDVVPPGAITNLQAQPGSNPGEIILTWTAPGDNQYDGDNLPSARYILKYATYSVDVSSITWWTTAIEYVQQWTVSPQGVTEQKVLIGFLPGVTYYFAIRTVDDNNNVSELDLNAGSSFTQAKSFAQTGMIGSLIRINEVAPDQSSTQGYDWIEFYNASTQDVNIFGWKIYEVYTSSTVPIETIEANWNFPSGSYLVLRFGQSTRNMSNPQRIGQNYYELYTNKQGLAATDNIIILTDVSGRWIDVVCYADRSGSLTNSAVFSAAYNFAISTGQWFGPYADGKNSWLIEYYCASSLFMSSNRSIARDENSTDGTNPSYNEWYLTTTLTPGAKNAGMDRIPPANVSTLKAEAGVNRGHVKLSWISVGDDDYTGTASGYILRYGLIPIVEENFLYQLNADKISKDGQNDTVYMKPQQPGKLEMVYGALPVGVTYYFVVKVLDERVNMSGISNVISFVSPDIVGSNIRINEFAVLEPPSTGDWVELYNASTISVNVKGWTLWGIKSAEKIASKIKELPDITLKAHEYLVVNCISGTDETDSTGKGENGYWDVYSSYDIHGFEGVLFLTDISGFIGDYGNIVDFVAYTKGSAPQWTSIWNTAVAYNQWSPYIEDDNEGILYAVDWSSGQVGYSLGRDGFSTDTDNITQQAKNDWKLFIKPTKGIQNDDIPPRSITDLEALSGDFEGAVKLQWTSPGDDKDKGYLNNAKYRIKYSTVDFLSFTKDDIYLLEISTTGVQPGTKIEQIFSYLEPGTKYYFGIITCDDVGNWSTWIKDSTRSVNVNNFAVALDLPPHPPGNVSVENFNREVKLLWSHPVPDYGDIDKYLIYIATYSFESKDDQNVVNIKTVSYPLNSITITGLKNATSYYFRIISVDKGNTEDGRFGEVLISTYLSPTVVGVPKVQPPKNLSAKHYGDKVLLTWAHSPDVDADNFLGYKIYRSTVGYYYSEEHTYIFVSSVSKQNTEWIDNNNVSKFITYYYIVKSVDSDEIESEPSNIAVAIVDFIPPEFVYVSKPSSRDLLKGVVKIELKVVDDRYEKGDRRGKILFINGKYRKPSERQEYEIVKFEPSIQQGITEYIGVAEFDITFLNISNEGVEYCFTAIDEINITSYPEFGWAKLEPPKDKPEQKFITPKNPEVVFGKEVEEVVIRDYNGNEIWRKRADGTNIIVWRGEDRYGRKIESGAYIYQIKTKDGKIKYGVVIVAK